MAPNLHVYKEKLPCPFQGDGWREEKEREGERIQRKTRKKEEIKKEWAK